MTCANCDPTLWKPGKIVEIAASPQHGDLRICAKCGDPIYIKEIYETVQHRTISKTWDKYFHQICISVAEKSPCLSRKIGAILVKDKSIVSTGYNGPPRGIPHCGHERYMVDRTLSNWLKGPHKDNTSPVLFKDSCPRKVMGFKSGEGMEWCPAQHAEENAISNAARLGVSVLGTTLYMNSVIPCQKCFGTLINAGISEIVIDEAKVYDKHTRFIIDNSNITIRRFEL